MKLCLQNVNVKNKKILLRVDYNVPISNGIILDDTKIKETLETIFYLLKQNCTIIILSHLGKIKTNNDKERYSLENVAIHLKKLLGREVYFSKENIGQSVIDRVNSLIPGDILVLENTRFLDIPNKLESKCDAQLSLFWSNLADVFVNDAFGSSHRKHASTYGVSTHMLSCIGFLMQKEISSLDRFIIHPIHPFTVIMGGAKIDDKMNLIEALLPKCEYLLFGGGIANTCLKALDFNVGESLVSDDPLIIDKVKKLLFQYKSRIMLPLDAIVGNTYDKDYVKYKLIHEINDNEIILDIGIKTLDKYQKAINESETIFLNGTVGLYENMKFANGTKELFQRLANSKSLVVVGGGDAAASVRSLGYENSFTYISSGGGATLEYLASGKLVALDAMMEEGEYIETLDM